MAKTPHAAVILAGCGHIDGSEIREAVLTLLALDQHGATWQCLALDRDQHHVVDHRTGQPVPGARRNLLEESSRIARVGKCQSLVKADPQAFDCLLIPGGFGVAKNHCSFAFQGAAASVDPQIEAFVRAFFEAGKPVGAICVSPALAGLVLRDMGRRGRLTLGNAAGPQSALEQMGHEAVPTATARAIVVDETNRLITTPAYMFDDARLSDIQVGIEACVKEVLHRIQ